MTEVGGPQPRRLRRDHHQPDRGGGAGEIRGQSDPRAPGRASSASKADCSSPTARSTTTSSRCCPRAAFRTCSDDKTVIRGGVGLFSYDYYFDAGNQTGFSQPTAIITTTNNGTTFLTDLTNPLPGGSSSSRPARRSARPRDSVSRSAPIVPSEREVPYYTRWQIGAQRDLGARLGRGGVLRRLARHATCRSCASSTACRSQYLSTSRDARRRERDVPQRQVANPFQGLLPGTAFNGANIPRQLLRPFPQFLRRGQRRVRHGTISVGTEEYVGIGPLPGGLRSASRSASRAATRCWRRTRARELRDKLNYLNPADGILEDRISPNDRPHRATLGGTLRFRSDAAQRCGSDWNGVHRRGPRRLVGQRDVSVPDRLPADRGTPDIYYDPTRDPQDLAVAHRRRLPGRRHRGSRLPGVGHLRLLHPGRHRPHRSAHRAGQQRALLPVDAPERPHGRPAPDGHRHLQDLRRCPRACDLQLRIETINALNYTVLWNPEPGPAQRRASALVNQDRNNPRDIQIGAKLTF